MNRLFLVEGTVTTHEYMSDKYNKTQRSRLVWAENDSEASAKFVKSFEAKTSEYSTYYSAYVTEVSEAIG